MGTADCFTLHHRTWHFFHHRLDSEHSMIIWPGEPEIKFRATTSRLERFWCWLWYGHSGQPTWILASDRLPTIGQRIVAEYETDEVWAGRYLGVKQNFVRWLALPEGN